MKPLVKTMGRCPQCGKVRYLSRRDAKRIRRAVFPNVPDMQAYLCGEYYHVGRRRNPDAATATADGRVCRDPRKKHYPTELAARDVVRPLVARHQLPPDCMIKRCACGDGWVIIRTQPHRTDRPKGAAA